MKVRFKSAVLDGVDSDPECFGGLSKDLAKVFRKRMQQIKAAPDERTFYSLKSLHFEKLKGDRQDQHSIMLNDQWRLIIEFEGESPDKTAVIVEIVDYH